MPLTIVVGGQFGSEGKGAVTYYFMNEYDTFAVIRCGGIAPDIIEKLF
jgi:adenylosuccinate synthase